MKQVLIATVVAAFSALALAAPAQADEQSYLDYLRDHHYATGNFWLWNPQTQIDTGYKYCGMIRSGTPASSFRLDPLMVEAAQHELCPDTLG